MYSFYLEQFGKIPTFLKKYLKAPSLVRLQKVGYFCGMDYASSKVYSFSEKISRFDHSLSVSLFTYFLTHDKKAALAGLIHDLATPCFSHVIDYMNEDFETQESTEEFTEEILRGDSYFLECLEKDHLQLSDIFPFKQFSVVDNERPKLCVDRLDGIILTGISWTKEITKEDISWILSHTVLYQNEEKEVEIGFSSYEVSKRVMELSHTIDLYCHSDLDHYMMLLLAKITKRAITLGILSYKDLYFLDEENVFSLLSTSKDPLLQEYLYTFYHIVPEEIPKQDLPNVKRRIIYPLVCGKRVSS